MSFPRAKIHRFNEIQTDVPSPTRYDPKSNENKAKGCVIGKGERERSNSTSDTHSTGGTPFRTPYSVVKKHSCLASVEKSGVARGINLAECGVFPSEGDEATLRAELADKTHALSDFQKLVEELTQQANTAVAQKTQLESQLKALELAKADLECVVSNNRNCETRIQELTDKLAELEGQLEGLLLEKAELKRKWTEEEARFAKLEDGNVEYEKKIISLEGTLEQVTLEYNEKVQEVRSLQESGGKLKISIECLQGKISTLENEVSRLEAIKSQNEQTIFGLEERTSAMNRLAAELEERKKACCLHEDTITGLDMQLGTKQEEIAKLQKQTRERISALDEQIVSLNETLQHVEKRNEAKVVELSERLAGQESKLKELDEEKDRIILQNKEQVLRLVEEKENCLQEMGRELSLKEKAIETLQEERKRIIKAHEEEVFHLQNGWEKKWLAQMQESEQSLLEKEAVIKLAELKHTKMLIEAREEWETQLCEAEAEASRRQSAQLEAGEMLKAKYEARVADLEASISQVLTSKAREAAIERERYKEVSDELTAHINLVKEKEKEIAALSSCNHKSSARLNNMLEEIKLLNSENETKTQELNEMTSKFKVEWKKNEKLSEQLGELDSKMATIQEELKGKAVERERVSGELKKTQDECNALKMKNLDLQISVVNHQDTANNLSAALETSRVSFNSQLVQLSSELSIVKGQCRKFEIAMTDTRKSLEALGKRLIDSENEVERLNQENEAMTAKLTVAEDEKNNADNNYRRLMDVKIDLEQRILAAEKLEEILKQKVKELELKNCDLELSKNEVQILKDTLEEDKKGYEAALVTLREVINEQNLKMVQLERMSLEQVEAVSQSLISKIEEFQRFSTQQIQKLNSEIHQLNKKNEELASSFSAKCEDYENLFTDHDILKTTFDIATKESQSLKKHYEEQRIQLDNSVLQLSNLSLERNALADKLETANKASENLATDLEQELSKVTSLTDKTEEQQQRIAELESEVSAKQAALTALNNEISSLKKEFEDKMKRIESAKDSEIELLIQEKKEYQAKLLKNTDEIVGILLLLETERNNVEKLEEGNKKLSQTIQDLQATVSNLKSDAKESDDSNNELASQLEKMKSELVAMEQTQEATKAAHEEEMRKLSSEVAKAKEGGDWKVKWERLLEEKEAMATELLTMTDKKDQYKFHCQRFEQQLAEANADHAGAVKDFNEIHVILQERDEQITKLKKRAEDLETLIGPFREQLEQYETERLMLENDREQLRRQHLDQAAKLGHQNHKQKIQHVVKLKADILELRKENQKLQYDLKSKNKLIENLREEVGDHPKRLFLNGKRPTSTPFKGKENDGRMSPIAGLKQEPMSPSTLLRERNF